MIDESKMLFQALFTLLVLGKKIIFGGFQQSLRLMMAKLLMMRYVHIFNTTC